MCLRIRYIFIALGALCATVISLNGQGRGARTTPSPLALEAQRVADQFWSETITKCGDSLYVVSPGNGTYAGGAVTQLKGSAKFRPAHSTFAMSQADIANGLEWEGAAELEVRGLKRGATFGYVGEPRGLVLRLTKWWQWEEVSGEVITVRLRKENGEWSAEARTGYPKYREGSELYKLAHRTLSCPAITAPLPSPEVNAGLFITPETDPYLSDIR